MIRPLLCAALLCACSDASSSYTECTDGWTRFIDTLQGYSTPVCPTEGINSYGSTGISDACATCLAADCDAQARACYLTDAGISCGPGNPAYAGLTSCLTASCASACPDGVP